MPKRVEKARIALLDFSLQKSKMKMGVQILVTDPKNLDAIRLRESDLTKEKVMKIINAGANVVLCTGGIDDLCLKVSYLFIYSGVIPLLFSKLSDSVL
jgi:T-complex protein 1 subunit alpha